MRQIPINWLGRIGGITDLGRDEMLFGLLLAGLGFSFLLLLSMLATSWGDRQATSKAFIFSLVIHLSCLAGLFILLSRLEYLSEPTETEQSEGEVTVERTFVPDEQPESKDLTDRPVWDRVAISGPTAVERKNPVTLEIESPHDPTRHTTPTEREKVAVDPLNNLPESALPAPGTDAELASRPLESEGPRTSVPDRVMPQPRPERSASRGSVPQRLSAPGAAESIPAQPTPRRGSPTTVALASPEVSRLPGTALPTDARSPTAPAPASAGNAGAFEGERHGPIPAPIPLSDRTIGTTESNAGNAAAPPSKGASSKPQPERIGALHNSSGTPTPQVERTLAARPSPLALRPTIERRGSVRRAPAVAELRPRPGVRVPDVQGGIPRRETGVPAAFGLRKLAQSKDLAPLYGATEETERAVELSLSWLARHQESDGRWDASRFGSGQVERDAQGNDRYFAGRDADAGVTGLAVLCFLARGYTHDDGKYARTVEKGLLWLVRNQRSDGYLGGDATRHARMYCHGMATYALAEAYAMQSDKTTDTRLRRPLEMAVSYTLSQQLADGGWRYQKGQEWGDMSMFGWQLMALRSAQLAGMKIPAETNRNMIRFLRERSLGARGGLAAYAAEERRPTVSMTAESLFCKQNLGMRRKNPASLEAVAFLQGNLPRRSQWNIYYWYYATLAMRKHGGEPWEKWNDALKAAILAEQRTEGDLAGSWDPIGPWGAYGGRIYTTCLSTLCLEVYYRYGSLYREPEQFAEPSANRGGAKSNRPR